MRIRWSPLVHVLAIGAVVAGLTAGSPAARGSDVTRADGDVLAFGTDEHGSTADLEAVHAPIVGVAARPGGGGYWEVAADGAVYGFGTAEYAGDAATVALAAPVVGMAADPDGDGYWLAAADGGVFAFDAGFAGSAGGMRLAAPVVGIAARHDGGYWLLARDGGVLSFGAPFLGADLHEPAAAVAIGAATTGDGYWIAFADGTVRGFGTAESATHGGLQLLAPIVGTAADPDGSGHWLTARDGGVFGFDAPYLGGAAGVDLGTRPVVGIAADAVTGGYWLARRGTPSPAPRCLDDVFPVSAVRPGMAVRALATSSGTAPSPLTGSVVATIEDGIAPGIPIVVVELDSPALRAAGGIWFGMSGSPVYARDGRLLGAVSYVMSWGPSPYAGLTPAEAMVGTLAKQAPSRVDLPSSTGFTPAGRTGALVALEHPVVVSASSDVAVDRIVGGIPALAAAPVQRGSFVAGAATGAAIVPGAPIAMATSYGDATIAAVGTVTQVCEGTVLAFGHPWTALGAVTATANAVSVAYVQPDPIGGAYTIANIGDVVGATTRDSLVGLRVALGGTASGGTVITSQVQDRGTGASRRGTTVAYDVSSSLPWAAYSHLYANLLRVGMDDGGGTVEVRWTITGTAGDQPFTFSRTNRFSSIAWVNDSAAWDMTQLLDALVSSNPFVAVHATSIDIVASIGDEVATDTIVGLEVDDGSGFVPVEGDTSIVVQPGQTVGLRVELQPYRSPSTTTVDLSVVIPPEAAGLIGGIDLTGGASRWFEGTTATSFDELLDQLQALPRNDDIVATTWIGDVAPTVTTTRVDHVVQGTAYVGVEVLPG